MQKKYKIFNVVCGWVAFAIAAATYLLTMEPTASFWDCGEFISSAYKLDVGHPPGAPFFMLMGHFASLFASDTEHVAMCVNAMSAIASALTILFLFWTITALAKKLIAPSDKDLTISKIITILGAGMVGALAYTFSDTFWFSAVEGEVYASSSLFTAIVFWLILKWDEKADEAGSDKWLILIAYLMGISIGIHLLNLLTIPAIVLIYYYRRYTFSWKGFFVAMVASAGILAAVLYGIIPGSVQLACWAELLFVNALGCPFNTGMAVYLVLLGCVLIWAIIETYTEKSQLRQLIAFGAAVVLSGVPFLGGSWKIGLLLVAALVVALMAFKTKLSSRFMNTTVLMITVVLLGYSSYAAIVIRSSADTPMDQNSPDNVFSLKYYLNREQYGDRPLFYGATYAAPVQLKVEGNYCKPVVKEGEAQYAPDPLAAETGVDRYLVTGYKTDYKMMPEFCMLFPRMYSQDSRHIQAYKDWGQIKGKKIRYEYCGQRKTDTCPTFIENLRFFVSYQCNWMYWRYFMWNFAGRQNELQGYGDVMKGNWLSGIPFLDNARLGDQSLMPTELKENKGHNVYYMLPLLLGILGIVFQLMRKQQGMQNFLVTFMLFFLTGMAIVLYLNQTPYQPRERDYAYAGSFYAFCIWIGLGVCGIVAFIERYAKKLNEPGKIAVATAATVVCLGVPTLMAQQNWDDHDRSQRYCCRDFGANYLMSCDAEAIIYSNGDNDTFPLWYNQEVEGVGADTRVCNLSYLQTDWYIGQMKRPYYASPALPISWQPKDYMPGTNEVVYVDNRMQSEPLTVEAAFAFIRSDDPKTKTKERENYFPTDKLYIPIVPQEVLTSPAFKQPNGLCRYTEEQLADQINITVNRRKTRSEMMVLEMLSTNHWQRPIYFAMTVGDSYYQGLQPYFEQTGLAYQITPVRSQDGQPRVNVEKMYDNMMHKFRYGNMNADNVLIEENTMRMCRTHRIAFATLAGELLRKGDNQRAKEVLDYAEEMLPVKNVPYDYTSVQMAQLYFQLGEMDTANNMLKIIAQTSEEYLLYYAALPRVYKRSVESEIERQQAIFYNVLQIWQRYKQYELFDEHYAIFNKYIAE